MKNPYSTYTYLVLLLSLLLPSCISTMKVKVDVIDRTKLLTSPEVLLLEIFARSDIQNIRLKNKFYENQRNDIMASFEKVLDDLEEKNRLSTAVRPNLQKNLKKEIDSIYFKVFIPRIKTGINQAKNLIIKQEDETLSLTQVQIDALFQIKAEYVAATQILNHYFKKWAGIKNTWKTIINPSGTDDAAISSIFDSLVQTLTIATISNSFTTDHLEIFHTGLFNDPLNSVVAKAPKKQWENVYNKTVARNFMGNTDIAVVMETPGNFFIKGVRMDAENVTTAFAKTFSQGVQLLAKVNGLPINPQGAIDTSKLSAKKKPISSAVDARQKQQKVEIREKVTRLSAINMMDAIIAQKDSLADANGYKESLRQIKGVFQIHKAQLQTLNKN